MRALFPISQMAAVSHKRERERERVGERERERIEGERTRREERTDWQYAY